VATAVVEQRPDLVRALVIMAMAPDPAGKLPEPRATNLLLTRFPGWLLWRLRTDATIRRGAASGFTRPVPVPGSLVRHTMAMAHRDLVGLIRAHLAYLSERSLVDRLAGSDVPLLVLFGVEDGRWRSSSAAGYRALPGARIELLPGVGHMVMMEDPGTTGRLLLEFAATAGHPS
jgi:pimeloyl-ACP methyl ester carboxylesterase